MALTWNHLEAGLAVNLPYLRDQDNLVLAIAPAGGFVQLWQTPERLVAEAWGPHIRSAEHRLPAEMEDRLAAMGWQPPAGDPEANWSRAYPWPLAASTGVELAGLLVRTLRDLFGAATLDTLIHKGWNDRDGFRLTWPPLDQLRCQDPTES